MGTTTTNLRAVNEMRPTNDPPLTNEQQWQRLMEGKELPPIVKTCKVCNRVRPLDKFGLDKRASDGHTNKCIDCTRKYYREYRRKHRDNEAQASPEPRPAQDTGSDKPLRSCSFREIMDHLTATKCPPRYVFDWLKAHGYHGKLKYEGEVTI